MIKFILINVIFFNTSFLFAENIDYTKYGRCLLNSDHSVTASENQNSLKDFNLKLNIYEKVALAKASINAPFYKTDLKWNIEATEFIYDLVVLNPLFYTLNEIYANLSQSSMEEIQALSSDISFHQLLASPQLQLEQLNEYLGKLSQNFSYSDGNLIESLRSMVQNDHIRFALSDLYFKIQNAGQGELPTDPVFLQGLLKLSNFYISETLNRYNKTEVIPFYKLILQWKKFKNIPTPNTFYSLKSQLVPLYSFPYPAELANDENLKTLIEYYHFRSVENFLFDKNISVEKVTSWHKNNPKDFQAILQMAKTAQQQNISAPAKTNTINSKNSIDSNSNSNSNSINRINYNNKGDDDYVMRFIQSVRRVEYNTFDEYVWKSQTELNTTDKSIDAIARTLYGEAAVCESDHLEQYKAISAIIALRTLAVAKESQLKNRFGFDLDAMTDLLSYGEIDYRRNHGAHDFGRYQEADTNPIINEMPLVTQVVSRPGQFSIWKLANTKEYSIATWNIQFPKMLGYPNSEDISVKINKANTSTIDAVQNRVLCPPAQDAKVFNKAVEIATELYESPKRFAEKYTFKFGGSCSNKPATPFFYTHDASINFGKKIHPIFCEDNQELPIYGDKNSPLVCEKFQLYSLKESATKTTSNKPNSTSKVSSKKASINKVTVKSKHQQSKNSSKRKK